MLKVNGGHLVGHIMKAPNGGEFYAPKDAILTPLIHEENIK
jgi:hypothetical protein